MLKVELLPSHISVAVAEKIFFIGESIQLFERERKLESHGAVLKDKESEIYNQLVSPVKTFRKDVMLSEGKYLFESDCCF